MIRIKSKKLSGKIDAITSKSMAHRHIICSALSGEATSLLIPDISDDIDSTLDAVANLGVFVSKNGDVVTITPGNEKKGFFDCRESGTTLRFMLPIAASILPSCHFTGRGRLPQRPISQMTDILKKSNCILSDDKLPLDIKNRFEFSNVDVVGDVSSQYISGLLLSSVLQKNDVRINVTGSFESKSYVDMTVDVMKKYNVDVKIIGNSYLIDKDQRYMLPKNPIIEKDWSNSAFFLSAGAIGQDISVLGLDINSLQSDKKILDIIGKFGADINISGDEIKVSAKDCYCIEADMSQIPDLLPILSVLACKAVGRSRFYNAKRLRIKESDRINASCNMIRNLGGMAEEKEDELIIEGTGRLKGGTVDSFNDHRIAMSAAIASIICDEDVTIKRKDAVNKSYPKFFEDFEKLGGVVENII